MIARWCVAVIFCAAAAFSQGAEGPASSVEIHWDRSTLHLVAEGGDYARIARLHDGTWLAGFARGPSVWASRSSDEGQSWSEPVCVRSPPQPRGWNVTNSELLVLADGRVLYFYNERENVQPSTQPTREPDNGIGVAISSDDGKSWMPGKRICGGGKMWEPAGIELSDRHEIGLLFADETPYVGTGQQQISGCISRDGGVTWSPRTCVCFRPHGRDGMPVPLRLADGRVVMAIEDNGVVAPPPQASRFGGFKPSIVELDSLDQSVGGDDPRRWSALVQPLSSAAYAGAPYLVRVGGQTALSSQVDDASPTNGGRRQLVIWLGNANARNFADLGAASRPFAAIADPGAEQLWSSLTALDDHRLLAVTGTVVGGRRGIWSIVGQVH